MDEMRRYICVDPASSKKKGSDYPVMVVVGLGADQNYYLLDAVRDRLNLTERCAALFRLHRKWWPERVGFERYGMLSDIEYVREKTALG
jgi:phage terminase large subunit-like protein